jgi:hypothetical protein
VNRQRAIIGPCPVSLQEVQRSLLRHFIAAG